MARANEALLLAVLLTKPHISTGTFASFELSRTPVSLHAWGGAEPPPVTGVLVDGPADEADLPAAVPARSPWTHLAGRHLRQVESVSRARSLYVHTGERDEAPPLHLRTQYLGLLNNSDTPDPEVRKPPPLLMA